MFYKSSRRFKVAFVILSLAVLLAGMLALLAINQNKALATSGTVSVAISVSGNEEGGSATLSKTSYTSGDEVIVNWTGAVVDTDFVIPTSIALTGSDKTYSISDWIDVSAMQENNSAYFKQMGENYTMTSFIKAGEYVTKTHSFSLGTISNDCAVTVNFERVTPVYRLYNKITSEHLFTTNKAEYDNFGTLLEQGSDYWIGEGIDWLAPKSGNYVKRLYNAGLGAQLRSSHYYTSDATEIQDLVANQGWVEDSQENWFMSGGTTPIYTAYSEALGSSHHYTSSWNEWRGLDGGWDKEEAKNGIASNSASATGVANCIIGTNWSGTLPEEGQDVYTKGEWIQTIVDAYGLTLDVENASDTKFTDIDSSQYKDAIRIAEIHGVLDDGETFSPDSVATREFAADSAVRLIGYTEEGLPDCSDVSSIAKKNSVYLALKTGMFELSNGYFNPSADMLKADGKLVTDHFAYILSLRVVDESKNKGAEYNDNAVLVDENVSYEDNNGQLTIDKTEVLNNLKVGNVIVIGEKIAYKVDSFTEQDGKLIVNYSAPQLDDFITSLQVSSRVTDVDWSKAVLADGVTMELNNESSGEVASLTSLEKLIPTLSIEIPDKFEFSIKISNIELITNYEYEKSAKIKNSFVGINHNVEVSVVPLGSKNAQFSDFVKLYKSGKLGKVSNTQEVVLFDLPVAIPTCPGITANLKGISYISLEGSISFKFVTTMTEGVQMVDNMAFPVASSDLSSFAFVGELTGKSGPKLSLALTGFARCELIEFEASLGGAFRIAAETEFGSNSSCVCMSASNYMYLDISIAVLDGWLYKDTWSIWTEDESPFTQKGHAEISGNEVEIVVKCTQAQILDVVTKSIEVSIPTDLATGGRETTTWIYQVLSNPEESSAIAKINNEIEYSMKESVRRTESTPSSLTAENVIRRRDIQVSYLDNKVVCFVDTSVMSSSSQGYGWYERGGVAYSLQNGTAVELSTLYYVSPTNTLNAVKNAVRTYMDKYGTGYYTTDEVVSRVSLSTKTPKGIALANRGKLAIMREGLVYITEDEEIGDYSAGRRGIIVKPSSDEYQVGEIVNGIS